jgi:hypothetical protein
MGLSGTGKSTFLAALWGSIKPLGTDCAIALDSLGAERDYLEGLWSRWVQGIPLEKTASEASHPVALHLLDKRRTPPRRTVLRIPDMSGETFREQFLQRQWTRDFEDSSAQAAGVLLFTHSENIQEGVTLAQLQRVRGGATKGQREESAQGSKTTHVPWSPSHCRTQVQLVDLLQFLSREAPLGYPRRLALLISAWDLLDSVPVLRTPSQWLARKMPLLSQYLTANPRDFTVEAFGISAQGFAYGDGRGARMAAFVNDWERVRVVRGSASEMKHDITEPLQWLLDD